MSSSASDNRSLLWLSATASFAIIGCTWAFSIARYGGPDEPAHVIRAAAVADGDLLGKRAAGLVDGYRQVTVPASLASGDPGCFRHDETVTAECTAASSDTTGIVAATSAGTAPPWYYAIVGAITGVLSDGNHVSAYRMATVLLCAAILGYAFARSRRFSSGGWLLVALTPSAWFLFGVVGTSGIEIALVAVALVEAVGRYQSRGDVTSLWRVMVPLTVCLLLRPAAVIDIVVVALVVLPTVPRPLAKRSLAILVIPLTVAVAASLAWSRWTGLVVGDQRTADSDSLRTALRRSLEDIPSTAHQAVGALGWNEFYAPPLAQVVWIVALAFAIYRVFTHGPDRWWHAKWIFAALLLPTIPEVILHERIGEIWQGRYSIAFAVGGVLLAATAATPSRLVTRCLVVAASLAEVLTLWHTLRRYMVGLDGSLTLQHATWQPPLNAWLLMMLNASAMAWLAGEATGVFQGTPGGPETLH